MLYNEFLENVKCRDNGYNYNVYKKLESLYMENEKLTKEDVYSAGKKLVNNELSEEQKEIIKECEIAISERKGLIMYYECEISRRNHYIESCGLTKEEIKEERRLIKLTRGYIKEEKQVIRGLKERIKGIKEI